MNLPRWYRNGIAVWLCTGLPVLLVALLLADNPRMLLRLPERADQMKAWLLGLFACGFPVVALPAALLHGPVARRFALNKVS